jgi:hypothetical protein
MNLDWLAPFTVSTPAAIRTLECLFALSAGIQTLEYLRMRPAMNVQGLWSWAIQRQDIPNPLAQQFFDGLFHEKVFHVLLWARLIALISLGLQGANLVNVTFLFVSNLAVLIRWRGAFNGGSDFMTLVVLTGLLISQWLAFWDEPELGWRACFWYITIQSMTSYFVSGAVKLLRPEWRNGSAMTIFLNAAIHGPLQEKHLLRKPGLAAIGSWTFILWECAAPLALLDTRLAVVFCAIAALFHFLVFWFFGLNRFFWAWVASFPAILWCAGQINILAA